MRTFPHHFRPLAGGLAVAAFVVAAPLVAQAQDEGEMAGPNTGKISLDAGVTFTNEYWFRGIAQENQGLIAQPSVGVSVDVMEGVDANFGAWNSWHFQNPEPSDGDDDFWYEADISAGLGFDLPGNFSGSLTYINLYGPSGGDEFAEEIDLGLSYDDSGMWGENSSFSLSPSLTLAREIDGGSDLGSNKGTYLGLGVTPSWEINAGDKPITLGVPMSLGLGLDDYYEDGLGNDDTFGFFDVGLTASMPLASGTDYGDWTLSGGVHYITLGDSAAQIGQPAVSTGPGAANNNGGFNVIPAGEEDSVYFTLGVSMSY